MKVMDRGWQQVGRLRVLPVYRRRDRSGRKRIEWLTMCSCGSGILKWVDSGNLGRRVKSCGCLGAEVRRENGLACVGSGQLSRRTHGMRNTKLYRIWESAKQRVTNPNVHNYGYYSQRGMLQEWQDSFEVFAEWAMTNGYEEGMEIHRSDNDRGYFPDNTTFLWPDQHRAIHPKYNVNAA